MKKKATAKKSAQKKPRLFYYEDSQDAWIPAPDRVEDMINTDFLSDEDEVIELRFKRADLTDKEMRDLPECGRTPSQAARPDGSASAHGSATGQ